MKRSMGIVLLVFLIFFVVSFLTNILGPLVPDIISSFALSLTLAGFLPFSFFVAYGVMSIPAGVLLDRFGQKPILIAAFVLAFGGSFLFASTPTFTVALVSLFMIGIGMTMTQVAINPLLRVAGGEENFAFYSVMGQLVFGAASFLSPHVYSYLVTNLGGDAPAPGGGVLGLLARVVPSEPAVGLALLGLHGGDPGHGPGPLRRAAAQGRAQGGREGRRRLPRMSSSSRTGMCGSSSSASSPMSASEQGVANWVSRFLETYHGLDPQVEGARAVSYFWGLLTAGCLLGLVLLKLIDARKVLVAFTAASMLSLGVALVGSTAGLLRCLHDGRLLPVGDVVGDLLARPQLGGRAPRVVLRHSLHRNRRRCGGVGPGRLARRSVRSADRYDAPLRDPRLHPLDRAVGEAIDRQRHRQPG